MPLVPAKCTQCGANLQIDPANEATICPSCNTPFITEKAINNYNTTNVTNIGNIHADTLVLQEESKYIQMIKGVEALISLKKYEHAECDALNLIEEYPNKSKSYLLYVKAYTENYTHMDSYKDDEMTEYLDCALNVATDEEKDEVTSEIKKYKKFIQQQKEEQDAQWKYWTNKLEVAQNSIKEEEQRIKNREKKYNRKFITIYCVIMTLIIILGIVCSIYETIKITDFLSILFGGGFFLGIILLIYNKIGGFILGMGDRTKKLIQLEKEALEIKKKRDSVGKYKPNFY